MKYFMLTLRLKKLRIKTLLQLACLCAFPLFAQQQEVNDSITGRVIDAGSRLPVPGIAVKSGDGNYSTLTDDDGCFVLKTAEKQYLITIAADGYCTEEKRLSGLKTGIDIFLHKENLSGNYETEPGLFEMKKSYEINNAQASYNNEMPMSDISVETIIQNKLGASVRTVLHSGSAAGGAAMFVRGINSINTVQQPLIVIDGVIFNNLGDRLSIHEGSYIDALSCLDVDDIEDVTVLKDGTSLYGSKGGNGVILINTKRGKSMITRISVNAKYGINEQPGVLPVMDADDYRIYLSDLIGSSTSDDLEDIDQSFLNDDEDYLYYKTYHNNTNWTDEVYRKYVTKSCNVNVNGGDERALYNLSLGYTAADNGMECSDFSRLNARFNTDIDLTSFIDISFDIFYSSTQQEMRNDGISDDSDDDNIDAPGYLALLKAPFLYPYQYTNSGVKSKTLEDYDFLGYSNPVAILQKGEGGRDMSNFTVSLTPKFRLSENLNLSNHFCYTLTDLSENSFRPMEGVAPYYNSTLGITSYNQVKSMFGRYQSQFNDIRLSWVKELNNADLTVNVGNRLMNERYKSEYACGHNTGSDQVKEMSSSLGYKTVDGTDENNVSINNYAVVDYVLNKKYFITLTTTAETNSRFGDEAKDGVSFCGQKWGVFPGANFAWDIRSEDFMAKLNQVSALKLRLGYELSGNDKIEPFSSQSYFSANTYLEDAVGLSLSNIGNSEIQWETTTKRNVGLDVSLFNNRISFETDFYYNTTNDLLVEKELKAISGMDSYWCNDGKLENKGFEIGIKSILVEKANFSLEAGANIAHYKNELIALPDGDYTVDAYDGEILYQEGSAAGLFYGYKTDGVFASASDATEAGKQMKTSTGTYVDFEAGDVKFVDLYDDDIINDKDKTVIGDPNPDFYGDFYFTVNYKNLSLFAGFNFSYGNDIYNCLRSQLESGSNLYNQSTAMVNRWMNEGQVTSMPKATYGDPHGNSRFSDRWIEDGSYLRFKTLEVSYKVPFKIAAFQGLTVWLSAQNLFTFTKYLGVDPEVSAGNSLMYQGIDVGLLPQSRGYYAGIKISL